MKTSALVKFVFASLLVTGVIWFGIPRATAIATPQNDPELANGFIFAGDYSEADAVYLQQNLDLLRERLPDWYQYFMEARPVTFNFDPKVVEHGRAAEARCCDESGMGTIKLGYHFGQMDDMTDPNGQTLEARRIIFFGLLAHELTHIRDQRAGRFTTKSDRKTCIAVESSGLNKQLEIKRDLLNIQFTDNALFAEAYRTPLDHQILVETKHLHDRAFWNAYCGNL